MGDLSCMDECDLCGDTWKNLGQNGQLQQKTKLFNDDKIWSYIYHRNVRQGGKPEPPLGMIPAPQMTFTLIVGESFKASQDGRVELCGRCAQEVESLEQYHQNMENLKKAIEEKVDKIDRILQERKNCSSKKGAAVLKRKLSEWKTPTFQRRFFGAVLGKENITQTLNFLQTFCKNELPTPSSSAMVNGHAGPASTSVVPCIPRNEPQNPNVTVMPASTPVPRPQRRFLFNRFMIPSVHQQQPSSSQSPFVMPSRPAALTNGNGIIYFPMTRTLPMATTNVAPINVPTVPPPPKKETTLPESIAAETLISLQHQQPSPMTVDETVSMTQECSPYSYSEESQEQEEDDDDEFRLVISDVRSEVTLDDASPSPSSSTGTTVEGPPKKRRRKRYISIPCEVCGKMVTSHNMPGHMRVHTGEKPWTCEHCGKDFRYNSSYYRHLREVHEVYDGEHQRDKFLHKCSICGKILRCKEKLGLHMTEIHGIPVEAILEENPGENNGQFIVNGEEGEMQGMENGQIMGMGDVQELSTITS